MYFANSVLRFPFRAGQTLLKYEYFTVVRRTITTTPIRSNIFNIGKRMRHETFYKKLDKVNPDYELIYRAPFEYLTAFCKHVPTFNLVAVSAVILYKFSVGIEIIDLKTELVVGPSMSTGTELIVFGVAFFLINIAVLYGVTKYPLRIYKHEKGYIAMYEGYLPFSPRQFNFNKGDVRKAKHNILPWNESIYKIRNESALIYSHHFKKPSDFNHMVNT